MAGSDGLSLGGGQGVQHAVVGMHRRQAVPVHLVLNNLRQAHHAMLVVLPVTHNLFQHQCNVIIGKLYADKEK